MVKEMKKSKKSLIRRIFSAVGNFIFALLAGFVIIAASGALMLADSQTKYISGETDSPIFSYNKVDNGTAEVIAFGEKFTVNYGSLGEVNNKLGELARMNAKFMPSIFLMTGEITKACLAPVGETLLKIPGIIKNLTEENIEK